MTDPTGINTLLAEMTLEEKCRMVVGQGPWIVDGCERLGVPEWTVSDGPVGVRGRAMGPGLLVPGPSAIAATWDVELVERIGDALAEECIDRRVDLLLGPTVNLHRSPRGGRHFESYSEDPELSSRIAVAYIQGVQSRGIGACVKHFVANDQEFERHTIDVHVDERALREIYLPPFEAAVLEADVRSVMGAYNFVNGHHGCAHPELLDAVLKREWGFDGFVVSDWGAVKETIGPALHGLDLEMPGPGAHWSKCRLQSAIEAGEVPESLLDDKVGRILRFLDWRHRIGTPTDHDEQSIEHPGHRDLASEAAAASIVLVKNEKQVLPLPSGVTVALIGPGAAETALLGGGSASLIPHHETNVLDALRSRLGEGAVTHAVGVDMHRNPAPIPAEWIDAGGIKVELFEGTEISGEPFFSEPVPAVFNIWFDDTWPEGIDTMSVRMQFAVTPPESGVYRVAGLGFALARLYVDGELVADSAIDPFTAGLGLHGGAGLVALQAGKSHEIVLEHRPRAIGFPVSMVDVRAELVIDDRESLLADAERVASAADIAVVVVGSSAEWESEGTDRTSIHLPNGQDELVERVRATNPRTVVVLNCGAPMLLPWLDDVPGVLLGWYPGQEGGEAIADVLLGEADPGGRMPTTWARHERDTPSYLHYPGEAGVVRYGEGIYVGYRWYDARGIEPLIPFGHGGSFTTFDWGQPTITGEGTDLAIEVPVNNTGERTGTEVVQIYVAPGEPPVHRPVKELAGFAKVTLNPGATATARIQLRDRSFARWDVAAHEWVVDSGAYTVVVGASATDTRHEVEVRIQ